MDFFDKIGSKLSSAGQGVANQTKNITGIAKLNSNISSNERAISELYSVMGQMLYQHDKDNQESFAVQYIQKINSLMSETEQLKKRINQLKDVKVCPNCGKEVSSKSMFCNYCGGAVPQINVAKCTNCPACGNAVVIGNKFCNNCGNVMPTQVAQPMQPPMQQNPQISICQNCGNNVPAGNQFCNVCGASTFR